MSESVATGRSSSRTDPASAEHPALRIVRALVTASVLLSADIHLVLYADGYAEIPVIGPLFLVNVVAGLLIGVFLLIGRHWFWAFTAAGFGAATFAAYLISATVGLFGVQEQIWDAQSVLAAVAEIIAVIGGVVLLGARLRSKRPVSS